MQNGVKNVLAALALAAYTYLVFGKGFDAGTSYAAKQIVAKRKDMYNMLHDYFEEHEEELEDSEKSEEEA